MVKNIAYDYDALKEEELTHDVADAAKVFKNRRAVCEGFANLTAAFLRSIGISTMSLSGNAGSPVDATNYNHAWNMVFIDGRWHFLDATWDNHTRYENGKNDDGKDNDNYMFFDMTPEMVSYSHYTRNTWFAEVVAYAEYKGIVHNIDQVTVDVTYGPVTLELDQGILEELGFPEDAYMEYELLHPRDQVELKNNKLYFNGYVAKCENPIFWGYLEEDTDTILIIARAVIHNEKFVLYECAYYPEDRLQEYIGIDEKISRTLKTGEKMEFPIYFFDPDVAQWDDFKNTLDYTIQYESSNPKIATVSKKGIVTAKKKGTCTITAKVKVGIRTFTYTLKLKCK